MTLQYAKELLMIELAQIIDAKNKRIEELEIENSMLKIRLEQAGVDAPIEKTLSIAEIEDKMIREALIRNNNNRRKTAQDLGISERTLYRKLQELDIEV